jgi:hypothetical protein
MALDNFIHHCAKGMLDIKELPLDLRNYLDDVEIYANSMRGTVASRQVVAIALATYSRIRKIEKNLEIVDWNNLIKDEE